MLSPLPNGLLIAASVHRFNIGCNNHSHNGRDINREPFVLTPVSFHAKDIDQRWKMFAYSFLSLFVSIYC